MLAVAPAARNPAPAWEGPESPSPREAARFPLPVRSGLPLAALPGIG